MPEHHLVTRPVTSSCLVHANAEITGSFPSCESTACAQRCREVSIRVKVFNCRNSEVPPVLVQGRLESDIGKLKREQAELDNKQRALQMNILRGNEQMEQFKLVMNWNQEEFEQWDAASKQKEDDNLALEKYARQDEARIKDLTLTLEKVSKEVQTRKRELDNEITETQV